MADDDDESLPYSPAYHISLPAKQTVGLGVQQRYGGGGTGSNRKVPDLAAAGEQQCGHPSLVASLYNLPCELKPSRVLGSFFGREESQ